MQNQDLERSEERSESLSDKIKRLVEEAAPEGVTMRDLQPILNETPPTSISATLSQLRADREKSGIVRIAPGEYAYRPDSLDEDTGDVGPPPATQRGQKEKIITVLKEAGKPVTTADIAEQLQSRFGMELSRKQISSALVSSVRNNPHVERVGIGVYYYDPNATDAPALDPFLTDAIPDGALEEGTGLRIVARAQDGARIAVDQNGVAWRISVKIESRLL